MRFKKHINIEAGLKQLEITPLIDCVFLLLIFFMLTSNFVVSKGINIKLPRASVREIVKHRVVTVVISSEDIVYVNGKIFTHGELERYLKKLKPPSIFIKADRDSTVGTVVEIWDVCKRLGINKIGIATVSGEDHP